MTEVRHTDPKTGGQKGVKSERYDLIPFEALDEVARVYAFGATKYDDHNWRKGYPWSWSLGALGRHLSAIMRGEDRDPESGCLHAAHIAWHGLTLVVFVLLGLGTDDRAATKLALPPVLDPAKAWPQKGDRVRICKPFHLSGQVVEVEEVGTDEIVITDDGERLWYRRDEIERP